MNDELEIRVDYDNGSAELVDVVKALTKFFGGEVEEIYQDGEAHIDFIIKKGLNENQIR
mgnify:CR=1 FL=1